MSNTDTGASDKHPRTVSPTGEQGNTRAAIAGRLRALRGHRKQSEVAALCGIHQATWSLLESGKQDLDAEKIAAICRVFGCTSDWLLFGRGPAPAVSVDLPTSAGTTANHED